MATTSEDRQEIIENPPGDERVSGPSDQPGNIALTLQKLNENMSCMSQLLTTVCDHLPIGETRPPGMNEHSRKRRYSSSSGSEDDHPARGKSRREADALSVNASDEDVQNLLSGPPASASKSAEKMHESEDENELLKELEEALQDEEKRGPKINQQLADIVIKRWGKKLAQEKNTNFLGKHAQPENCRDLIVARVNPEIWVSLNAYKRKADLRMANMQQALQKATYAIITTGDKFLAPTGDKAPSNKEMLASCIDAVALMGHVVSELSNLRRDQIKPALKAEYHALCTNDSPHSKLLFGDDLAKQVRDAKETNRIGNTVGATKRDHNRAYRHDNWQNKQVHTNRGGYRQPFLGKSSRSYRGKKQNNYQRNKHEKK